MKKNNKKISKIIAPLALASGCLAALPATSCGSAMYSSVKYIAPYLHEITYDDYTYDKDFITTKDAEAFGCSSVRNGNFYGRNFDYIFNDTPEFIVRVKANKEKKRHESIGVATHFGLRESKLLNGEYNKQLELVPNITLDGINDAGVICSHNVVSTEAYDIENEGTNPSAEKLHMLFIPRYVLDNADSAQHAIQLIKQRNIVGSLGGTHYLHVMIADAKETWVVEFFDKDKDGKVDVVEQKKENDQQIMTNYYVNNNGSFINNKRNGDERYQILKANYETATSFAGMEALMKKVMYSNAYRYNHDTEKMRGNDGQATNLNLNSEWYSESINYDTLYDPTFDPADPAVLEKYNRLKEDYWISRLLDYRNPAEPKFWQTTHNSTYDMENKHLRVVVQEQYEIYFDYYL